MTFYEKLGLAIAIGMVGGVFIDIGFTKHRDKASWIIRLWVILGAVVIGIGVAAAILIG